MNDRQKQHLKILSEMDEKIVEEVTVERYRRVGMLAKRKKKRLISILSAAASFIIVLSATMVLWKHFGTNDPVVPPDERQVPVYEGMAIESAETIGTLLATTDAPILFLDSDHNNGIGHVYGNDSVKGDKHNPNRGDEINQDKPFGEDNLILDAAKDSLSIVGADQDMYYAKPNEDIYFVIHINNPDAFEILSFTINGTKYSSYMFEEGSDLETLILKYNVGDVEGIVEYTIDAIKYIDGTEIKDVRMEGDRTVTAGIYTEEIQPKLTLTAENIGLHSLSFRVSVADEKNLIGGSEGKAYAVLYDGETILKQTELKVGEETTVTFDGLQSGKLYEYAIIGVYDAFDGNKVAAHTLTSKAFYTESVVTFDEINVTDEKITYALKWSDLASNKTLKALTLTQGDTKTELDVNVTEIALLSDTEYTLTATYETNGKTETISISFCTWDFMESVGLEITDGVITGIGTCTDYVLYLNHPIAKEAFSGNYNVKSVVLGKGVTSIGNNAFDLIGVVEIINRSSLEFSLNTNNLGYFPRSVHKGETKIDNVNGYLFYPCTYWDNDNRGIITVNYLLGYVGDDKNLVLPDSYKGENYEIYYYAFINRDDLISVAIPDCVTRILDYAFWGCDTLIQKENGVHYVDRWVVDCDESLVTATLRPNTVGIANYAFQRSSNNLTSIMIPKSVMSIGYLAFGNCDKLSNITFENISDSQEWFVTVEYYMGTYHYENDDVIVSISRWSTSVPSNEVSSWLTSDLYREYFWYRSKS